MSRFERLLQKCKELKTRIRELKDKKVDKNQKTIKEIQLKMLRDNLSEVGRQLSNMTMYKREKND